MYNTNRQIRTRFAPSPTGFVHIGSLRTALFSFLYARRFGGKHLLRIEDTDQNRFVEGAVENLLRVMQKMGIEFDEGFWLNKEGQVIEQGNHGPYLQSKRLSLYQKHAKQLVKEGHAYYCFCSEKRLEELRIEQVALKKPPMYDRMCRNIPQDEVVKKLEEYKFAGKTPVIRQAIPREGKTVVRDLIYGDIVYDHKVLDDQVILKSDGFPTYHLAVVIDDHYMEVSHVIRGEEWIPSTPKHILLYQAFNWRATEFAHLPLIFNVDKSKLSKRQGDVSVEEFLKKGYLKEALLNFVAFLGWNPKTEEEIFSLTDLIAQFDLAKINKSGAVFDLRKLDWMNSQYIRKTSNDALAEALIPYWMADGYISLLEDGSVFLPRLNKKSLKTYLTDIAGLEKERLKKLSEIGERTSYFFTDPVYEASLLVWKKSTPAEIKLRLPELLAHLEKYFENREITQAEFTETIESFLADKRYDKGSVLWPLRVALTGLPASPGPFEVSSVIASGLGKEAVFERIRNAVKNLEKLV